MFSCVICRPTHERSKLAIACTQLPTISNASRNVTPENASMLACDAIALLKNAPRPLTIPIASGSIITRVHGVSTLEREPRAESVSPDAE